MRFSVYQTKSGDFIAVDLGAIVSEGLSPDLLLPIGSFEADSSCDYTFGMARIMANYGDEQAKKILLEGV